MTNLRSAAPSPPRKPRMTHSVTAGTYLVFAALSSSACGHTPLKSAYQSAYGVIATITSTRANPHCAEISTKISNLGTREAWIILSWAGPLVDPVSLPRTASLPDIRFSFSERMPASLPTHAQPPQLVPLRSHESVTVQFRTPLPIKEDPIYSSEYLGYGYPAPDWLPNVIRHAAPPFYARVNVGVISRQIDVSHVPPDDLWDTISVILREQYVAETQSVKVSASAISLDCIPGVVILRE